jgi:hypothetical protein
MVMTKEARQDKDIQITIDNEKLEVVSQYIYLGSLFTEDNDCSKEIQRRIGIASGTLGAMKHIWKSCNVSIAVKLKLLDACVFSSLLYACETWTMKKTDMRWMNSFEMKCYRKLLRITWSRHVTIESIRRTLGRQRDIVQKIKERKLSLFGHICRMRDS